MKSALKKTEAHQTTAPTGFAATGKVATALCDSAGYRGSAIRMACALATALSLCLLVSCGQPSEAGPASVSPQLATNGTIEITARLVEVPSGAIFKRDLYDYATILKYQLIKIHRGSIEGGTVYVGHYNPWKPRAEARDARVQSIGGNLKHFRAGEVHRMALEVPIEDYFMGGIVNKYFGQTTNVIHWAVWTDVGSE